MTIKEQLQGTCVLNESTETGAEIVALYTEGGIGNRYGYTGENKYGYYGATEDGNITWEGSHEYFKKVLTLSQLREIVSTPEIKEAPKEMQEAFVKANPEMKHSEPQFKAGQMVDVWNKDNKSDLQPAKYRFFADGKYWCETCASDIVVNFKNIEPNSECKLREKAEEMLNGSFRYQSIDKRRWIVEEDVKEMLIEAIKWSQENK